MINRIVVPVDFTPESDRALLFAPALAASSGASIELISVGDPIDRADIEKKLADTACDLGHDVTSRVVESGGPRDAVLLTELHRDESTLWCVGSHARSALGELFLGSLSEELVRQAHAPVVLVGPHATSPPSGRVLVVALDGTDESEAVLPAAALLASALAMTVRLVQVGRPHLEPLPADVSETAYLSSAAACVPSIERDFVDYDVLHGDHPAHDLAEYVGAHPEVGMLTMATRGLSGTARLLHRSTAFELAHRAVVPVAILHQANAEKRPHELHSAT